MATVCPGNPAVTNNPPTILGVTQTPNVPGDIFSVNNTDPFPVVKWTPTDEFCSFQFEITPGQEFIVPTTQWGVNWRDQDTTVRNDTQASFGNLVAAGFGVPVSSDTPVTGPATSGPITIGGNTLTVQIISGTVRVSMGNGSLFGYHAGDAGSGAVIKYTWANPINSLEHVYFNSGTDQTPTGIKNYLLSPAAAAPMMSNCVVTQYGRNGVDISIDVNTTDPPLNDADFNRMQMQYSLDGGGSWIDAPQDDGTIQQGDILVPASFNAFGHILWPANAGQSIIPRVVMLANEVPVETLTCDPITTWSYPTIDCETVSNITTTSADIGINANNFPTGGFNSYPAGTFEPANIDTLRVVYGTTPGGPYPFTQTNPATSQAGGGVFLTGLTPNTQYYYRIQATEQFQTAGQFLDQGECTFTTLATPPATVVACDPATAITDTTATLNGHGDAVPTTDFIRLVWGTTPGGPYPNIGPNVAGTNVNGQAITLPIAGLTASTPYYYRVDHVANDGTTVLGSSSECTFTTIAAPPPGSAVTATPATGVTSTTANANGTGDNIPVNEFIRIAVGPTGGPYTDLGPNVAGTNVVGQPISRALAGLTPSTQYCYVVQHLASNGSTVLQTSPTEQCFTTSATPPPPPLTLTDPPDQTDPTPGDLGQLCTTFTASTLNDTRSFAFTPPSQGGCAPVVTYVPGSKHCNPIAIKEPNVLLGMTTNATLPQPTYSVPGPGAHRLRFTKAANPDPICTLETTLTGGTGNLANPGFDVGFYFIAPGNPVPQFIGTPEATAAGFAPNTVMLPGATGTFTKAGVTVTFTFVSGGQARAGSGAGGFLHRSAADGNTTPDKLRLDFDPPVTEVQVVTNYQQNSSGEGFTDNMIAAAPTSDYQACCSASTAGSYPYQIQENDSNGPNSSPPQNFTFTWTAAPPVLVTTDPPTPAPGPPNNCVIFHGTSTNAPAGCTYGFIYGTTPGGPYPTTVAGIPAASTGASPESFSSAPVCAPPGTTLYYKAVVTCGLNPPVDGSEVPAPIPGVIVDPCEPATNIDYNSATLHATAENALVGDTYRFRWGTTPGGPYPNIIPAGPASGASPESYSAPTGNVLPANSFIYYISEVLDSGNNVVAASPVECQFGTSPFPLFGCGPTLNVTETSASIGANDAFVPAGHTIEWKYGTLSLDHSAGPVVASGASPDTVAVTITGLTPNTNYCYTAYLFDENHNLVATSDQCCFTTAFAFIWCGGYHNPNECHFVPSSDGGYFNCNNGV